MAITFKEVDDKLRNSPLDTNELAIIKEVEDYIDKEIKRNYNGYSVKIDLPIARFEKTISQDSGRNLVDVRRKLMITELKRRFEEAGWKYNDEMGDSHSMYSPDYWVLSGEE